MNEVAKGFHMQSGKKTAFFSFLSMCLCCSVGLEGLFSAISGNVTHG